MPGPRMVRGRVGWTINDHGSGKTFIETYFLKFQHKDVWPHILYFKTTRVKIKIKRQ